MPKARTLLKILVGVCAIVAPALHSTSDILEWYQHGLTPSQLWLSYIAFLPMPWLLFGICFLHEPKLGILGFVGALLYGLAFTYFTHTTLYALAEKIPSYPALWPRLGWLYTVYGTFMIYGALLFAWSAWRAAWLPRFSVLLFSSGIAINLLLWLFGAPDSWQTIGSAVRNMGLISIGHAILFNRTRRPI